ncbi:transposase, partial [Streptococcus suis]
MHLFIDDEKIWSTLSETGNPLERLDAVMDWAIFLSLLSDLFSRKDKVISRGGRPHLDYLMIFKVLLLQRLHNLPDDAMEYQLLARISSVPYTHPRAHETGRILVCRLLLANQTPIHLQLLSPTFV